MKILEKTLNEIKLDYLNNYLTTSKFAEHYEITNEQAITLLNLWLEISNNNTKQ